MVFVKDFFSFLSRTVTPIHNEDPKNRIAMLQIIKRTEQCKVSMLTTWLN